MKNEHSESRTTESRTTDGETRKHIMLELLQCGSLTASQLGQTLGLSATGIRRHLDNLVHAGLAEIVTSRKPLSQSRGRPAKEFRLTSLGKSHFGHDYDRLAILALAALRDAGGKDAVMAFARSRIQNITSHISCENDQHDTVEKTAYDLVHAFSENGYATTVTHVGQGMQICQHHCPIAEVAEQFPELCQAEHEAIAHIFGHHVQPLSSIAQGHSVCTTNIPLTPVHKN